MGYHKCKWYRPNGDFAHTCSCPIGHDHNEREHREQMDAPKPLTFTLTITLGNDAMRTPDDIAIALEEVSVAIVNNLPQHEAFPFRGHDSTGHVYDLNGNTVGEWSVQ